MDLSKEEILDKHVVWDRTCEDNFSELGQAMQEFADQEARKEAIAFYNFCRNQILIRRTYESFNEWAKTSDEEKYNLYFQLKNKITMKTGVMLIAYERDRQIKEEKFTLDHDKSHEDDELALAAAAYAIPEWKRKSLEEEHPTFCITEDIFPFEEKWFKSSPENRIRELVKSGALIAAEIDRLQNTPPQNDDI